eukprot:3510961-Amphidinium_carterae.1
MLLCVFPCPSIVALAGRVCMDIRQNEGPTNYGFSECLFVTLVHFCEVLRAYPFMARPFGKYRKKAKHRVLIVSAILGLLLPFHLERLVLFDRLLIAKV